MKSVEALITFQLAVEFKLEVYGVIESSAKAEHDLRYKSQLFEAASGIESNLDEGFSRNVPGEFDQFIRYALGSLAEARRRLKDGVHRKYFTEERCQEALGLAQRCADATRKLRSSLIPFRRKPRARRPTPPPRSNARSSRGRAASAPDDT